ncbi:MAG: biotin/lipoyl-binding protein, partial [Rhodospirillaceae bacterium]|nr:biotin/lipoyl-binding protein [Rhodospirillaceae bacterium]
ATVERHPQADENNPNHVPAPMPGVVGTIAVNEGQEVESGDLLLNIEAMKMETAIRAARSGTVHAIAVRPGMSVDAKDLLLEYAADA